MKYKIRKDFEYGSVSDPQKMVAGNVFEADTLEEATPERLAKWVEMGWVEAVE